jgi:hypothetical protein
MTSKIYLPPELKNHIVSFVPVYEVGMLSVISKNFSEEIPQTRSYQSFIFFRSIYRKGTRFYNSCRNTLINFSGYFSETFRNPRQL